MDEFKQQVEKRVQKLASAFEPFMTPIPVTKSGMHTLDTPYYIKRGAVLVFSNGNAFAPLVAPDFIGVHCILEKITTNLNLEFKLLSGAEVYTIDTLLAKSLAADNNLYETISYLIAQRLSDFINITEIFINPNSSAYKKSKVCINLFYEHRNILEEDITLSSFIIECTGISKSRVMFILSELRKGGYITMENGKLLAIAKLPDEF